MRRAAVQRITKGIALSVALASGATACGGSNDGPLGDVQALIILQRPARNEMGDIFQYTSYLPGARIVKLSPPSADGVQTPICCDQDAAFAQVDISGYDLSFDANVGEDGVTRGQLVFAAKRNSSEPYGLFMMSLETGAIEQLPTDPGRDYTSPVFAPGGKIIFTTNEVVEAGTPQHQDEYERGTTLQLGYMNIDGSGAQLGPRNLSHRVFPTMMSDGRVMYTQWDHLGMQNAGHLMRSNPDLTQMREAFGKEGTGSVNSYLKAVEVSPGRVLAIGTSRDRTVQSGQILDIRMGQVRTLENDEIVNNATWPKGSVLADVNQAEATATFRNYTPDVPGGNEPSRNQVGRYYDVYPLNARDYPDILVAWADGPVESGTLGAAGLTADFGVYLYNTKSGTREPILNTPDMWDIFPRPLRPRPAPLTIAATQPDGLAGSGTLIGSMNAYDSTIFNPAPGSIYGVRVMEGFSSEEGFPMDFGTTEIEGHHSLGVAPLADDFSWAAVVPANVPVHLQLVDQFGQAIGTEPVWTSGRPGEARICGGCHEDRTGVTTTQPGLLHAVVQGPIPMNKPRDQRTSPDYTRGTGPQPNVVEAPWDLAVQPVFNNNCLGCHDSGSTNGWAVDLVDDATGMSVRFSFSLSGAPVNIALGELMITGYSESYISMAGFMMEDLEDAGVSIVPVRGTYAPGMVPFDYANSPTAMRLNPVKQFPTPDTGVRVRTTGTDPVHNNLGLSADDHYLLTLASDMGVLWFYRQNNPGN
jgi:hypothetical protein